MPQKYAPEYNPVVLTGGWRSVPFADRITPPGNARSHTEFCILLLSTTSFICCSLTATKIHSQVCGWCWWVRNTRDLLHAGLGCGNIGDHGTKKIRSRECVDVQDDFCSPNSNIMGDFVHHVFQEMNLLTHRPPQSETCDLPFVFCTWTPAKNRLHEPPVTQCDNGPEFGQKFKVCTVCKYRQRTYTREYACALACVCNWYTLDNLMGIIILINIGGSQRVWSYGE